VSAALADVHPNLVDRAIVFSGLRSVADGHQRAPSLQVRWVIHIRIPNVGEVVACMSAFLLQEFPAGLHVKATYFSAQRPTYA
jgi:hypothetical protein